MLNVSNAFNQAFKADARQLRSKIIIGGRTFNDEDIQSLTVEYGSMGGASFGLGASFSNSLRIVFAGLVEDLKELDEIKVELGIVLPSGAVEYVKMGTFIINERVQMDRNSDVTTVESLDKFVMMGGTYVSKLGTRARIRDIALEIANLAGIEVDGSFANLSGDTIDVPTGLTYRNAIGLIAQLEAGFARFNRDGKLQIKGLTVPDFSLTPDDYISKGLVKNELPFKLNGIICQNGETQDDIIRVGSSTGNVINIENRSMTLSKLQQVFSKIENLNYFPFSLDWYGNPALEAGDWITIQDLKGNRFTAPNLGYRLEYNGSLKASSKAETEVNSDVVYGYKSPLEQRIEYIMARVSANGRNRVYDGITEPPNPEIGDIWFKPNGPNTEIWIYETLEDGTNSWVPKITNDLYEELKNDLIENERIVEEVRKVAEDAQAAGNEAKVIGQDAKAIGQQASIRADQSFADAQKAILKSDAAQKEIADSIANTQFTSLAQLTNELNLQSKKAQQDADAALGQAISSYSLAEQSIKDANKAIAQSSTAITEAQKALTATGSLSTKLETVSTVTYANQTAVGLKADKTVVDTLSGKVDNNTLAIQATADGLKIKADQSTVDTLNGRVINMNAQLDIQAGQIQTKVGMTEVNGAIDKVVFSDRNYLLDSKERILSQTTSQFRFLIYKLSETVQEDQIMTISGKVKVTEGSFTRVTFLFRAANAVTTTSSLRDIVNGNVSWTTLIPKGTLEVFVYAGAAGATSGNGGIYTDFYLKKSTNKSDWTPAPEDVQNQFKSVETSFNQTAQQIALKASQTSVDNLSGQVNSLSAQQTIQAGEINTKVTQAQVNTAIDGITIGDRNLLRNSKPNVTNANYPIASFDITQSLVTGEEVTIILKGILNTDNWGLFNTNGSSLLDYLRPSNYLGNNLWRLTFKWNNLSANNKLIIYPIPNKSINNTIEWIKLVRGNKTSNDWTPAPEDMASIIYVSSEIKQTADSITSTVSALDGRVTVQQQDLNKISQSVSDAQGNISRQEIRIDGIQTTVSGKADRSEITQLQNAINLKVSSSDVTAAILADKTIKDTRNDNQLPPWYYANYPKEVAYEFKRRDVLGIPGSSTFVSLTTRVPWTSADGGHVRQTAESSDGTFQRYGSTVGWTAWEKIADVRFVESQITILNNSIDLRVRKGDVIGQITTEAGRVLIGARSGGAGNYLMVTPDTTFIQNATIQTAHIADLAVNNAKIANLAVNNAKIADLAVDTAKIANAAITNAKIGELAVGTANIGNAAITNAKIANLAVSNAQIQDLAVSSAKIASLDVSKVSGNTLEFVRGNFNNAAGGGTSIDGTGIVSAHSNGMKINYSSGAIQFRNTIGDRYQLDAGGANFKGLGFYPMNNIYNPSGLWISGKGTNYLQFGQDERDNGYEWRFEQTHDGEFKLQSKHSLLFRMLLGASTQVNDWRFYNPTDSAWGMIAYGNVRMVLNTIPSTGLGSLSAESTSGGAIPMRASAFTVTSERKLKDHIAPLENASDMLCKLKVYSYNKQGKFEYGFIADEMPKNLLGFEDDTVSIYDVLALTVKTIQEQAHENRNNFSEIYSNLISLESNMHIKIDGKITNLEIYNSRIKESLNDVIKKEINTNKLASSAIMRSDANTEEIAKLKTELDQVKKDNSGLLATLRRLGIKV